MIQCLLRSPSITCNRCCECWPHCSATAPKDSTAVFTLKRSQVICITQVFVNRDPVAVPHDSSLQPSADTGLSVRQQKLQHLFTLTSFTERSVVQAMQGGGPGKSVEEEALEGTDLDDLAIEEQKQRDSDTMSVRYEQCCVLPALYSVI